MEYGSTFEKYCPICSCYTAHKQYYHVVCQSCGEVNDDHPDMDGGYCFLFLLLVIVIFAFVMMIN